MDTARFLWLCAALTSVVAQEPRNCTVGGELTLELKSPPNPIQRVVWKHGVNLLADLTRGRFSAYGDFKGYATVDTTGRLTIKNIQRVHAGLYSVEVNNQVQDQQYNVGVFKPLKQPNVLLTPLTCSYKSESCVLVCEVNTMGADPVSFKWLFGTELSENTGPQLKIEHNVEPPPTYTCRVTNPISEADSEPLKNPLIAPPVNVVAIVVGVCVLLLAIPLVIGAYFKRDAIKKRFCKDRNEGPPNPPNSDRPAETRSTPEERPLNSVGSTAEKARPPSEADADYVNSDM